MLDDLDAGYLPCALPLYEIDKMFFTRFTVKEWSPLKSRDHDERELMVCQVMIAAHHQALKSYLA